MCLILTVLIIGILAGAELDIFIPSFPEIQRIFHLSPFETQLVISLNFIAYCICSLIAGAVSDRYDKKNVIIYSMIIFVIGSFSCYLAHDYWVLLFGRILQGIGIAGPSVLGYVVIADKYTKEKQTIFIGWMHGTIAVAMSIAPIVGSYVTSYFSWRGNFAILLIMGILCLFLSWIFITSKKGNPAVSFSLDTYLVLLKSKELMLFVIAICLFMIPYWVFIGMSPILYMQDLGVSLQDFGFYQGTLAAVFGISSTVSGLLIKKIGRKKSMYLGIIGCSLHVFAVITIMIFDVKNAVIITACMAIASAFVVIPINILYPYSLDIIEDTKGKTSALVSGLRLLLSSTGLFIVSDLYNGTFIPIGLWVVLTISGGIAITLYLMKQYRALT